MRRPSNRFILAVALGCVSGAHDTYAQVSPGQRLRIVNGVHALTEGVYFGRDSLGYAVLLAGTDTVRVPMDGSYSAERFAGREAHGASAFMKSVVAGAAPGLVLLGATAASPNGEGKAIGMVVSGFVTAWGIGIGAVVGLVVAGIDHDVWQPVAFTPAASSASASQGAAGDSTATGGPNSTSSASP